jgi:hypothetical protein
MQRAHSVPSQLTLLSVLQRDAAAAENLRISKSTLLHVQNQQQRQRQALQSGYGGAYRNGSQAPPPAASSTLVAALEEAANGGDDATASGRSAVPGRRSRTERGLSAERNTNKPVGADGRTSRRVPERAAGTHEPERRANSGAGGRGAAPPGARGGPRRAPAPARPAGPKARHGLPPGGAGGRPRPPGAPVRLRRSATTGALDVIREASLDEELEELDDLTLREYWKRLDAWGITSTNSSANSSPRSSPAISPIEMQLESGTNDMNALRQAASSEYLQRRSLPRKDAMDVLAEQLHAEQVRRERDAERQRLLEAARSHHSRTSLQRTNESSSSNEGSASTPMMGLPWPADSNHLQGHDHVMQPPEMWRVQAHGFLVGHQMHTNDHGGWWVERWGQRRVNPTGPLTGDERNDYVRFGDKFGIDPDGCRWSEWWLELPERPGVARGYKWGRKTNGSEWNDQWER